MIRLRAPHPQPITGLARALRSASLTLVPSYIRLPFLSPEYVPLRCWALSYTSSGPRLSPSPPLPSPGPWAPGSWLCLVEKGTWLLWASLSSLLTVWQEISSYPGTLLRAR